MEQRKQSIWELGTLYLTRSGSIAQVFLIADKQMLGAWWDEKQKLWIPISWNTDGSFLDRTQQRPVDLTRKEWEH